MEDPVSTHSSAFATTALEVGFAIASHSFINHFILTLPFSCFEEEKSHLSQENSIKSSIKEKLSCDSVWRDLSVVMEFHNGMLTKFIDTKLRLKP